MSDDFSDSSGGGDSFTETNTEGWGSRLGGSLIAALIGLVLVPAAVVLLYWNEGRAVDAIRALDRGAGAIVEVNATAVDPKADRKLVHLTGTMRPGTPARDPAFSVTGDGYYPGQDQAQPAVGDIRVSFTGLASQTVSVAAASAGGMLTAFRDTNGYTIALAAPGAVTAAALFNDEMKAESTRTCILRGVGFVLVLIGFLCMTRPLTMPFAILPFLESIVGAGAFLAAITLSVPVTLVTIAIAWIVHRPLIGILLLVAAAGGFFLIGKIDRRRRPAGFMPGRG